MARAADLGRLGAAIGAEEARALGAADPIRVRRLARFFGRHFYRERIVRLFAAGRRLAREAGADPLDVLERRAFDLDDAELGSAATADAVARLVEAVVAERLIREPWGAALVAYEGARRSASRRAAPVDRGRRRRGDPARRPRAS